MLSARQAKIDLLSEEEKKNVESNEDLLKRLKVIDTSKTETTTNTTTTTTETTTADTTTTETTTADTTSLDLSGDNLAKVVQEVRSGFYGNGAERVANLKRKGYTQA
jgi:hypothetical protein